jgi:hypothetical protein
MCIIIKLQKKIQYCVGRKTSEPVSLNFCDQRNIAFSPVWSDDNANDKKILIFYLQQQKIHKIYITTHILLLLTCKHVGAIKFARKMNLSHF